MYLTLNWAAVTTGEHHSLTAKKAACRLAAQVGFWSDFVCCGYHTLSESLFRVLGLLRGVIVTANGEP